MTIDPLNTETWERTGKKTSTGIPVMRHPSHGKSCVVDPVDGVLKELGTYEKERDRRAREAGPDLRNAINLLLANYRTEGCPDPKCRICSASKAAEQNARDLLKAIG